jgi:predicted subunit of tRNA(5-methylaminomethyl-2-thiouridylate) methyltransferase
MYYAVKGNKQLKIEEAEKASYLNLGYDIAEQQGNELKVTDHAPSKTVLWAVHQKALEENAGLKKQVAESGTGSPEAVAALQTQLANSLKEIESLKAQLTEAKKTAKADK